MNENYKVYMHIFPNNKKYIGITKQKPQYRWRNGKKYENNIFMNNAIKKYKWENIEHKILYENLTKEEAEQKEIELISKYKSNDRKYGYNILKGGNVSNGMTKEMIDKMSSDRKGKHYSPKTEFKKGHKSWTEGKKMSKEFREKLSKSHIGQIAWNRKKVKCIENNKIYNSVKEASIELNIVETSIQKVCRGIMKQTHGLHFEYIK